MANNAGRLPSALVYWNNILESVSERASTADTWQAIRDAATALGRDSPGVTVGQVNELRGYAAGIRNASERIGRANPTDTLGPTLTATAPWSRSQGLQNATPMYQIQFEHQTMTEGQTDTNWRTLMIRGTTPPTVGDLTASLDEAGELLAVDYGATHVAIGAIRVMRI